MMSAPHLNTPSSAHSRRFDTLQTVAAVADQVSLDFFARRVELVREGKSQSDFVTEADRTVERCIREAIATRHPNDSVVGEELGGDPASTYWLIDPIDGTSNFLSGLPLWAISIAYIENAHPIFGVVSMPMLGRCLIGGRAFDLRDIGRSSPQSRTESTQGGCATTGSSSLVFGIGQNALWPTPGGRELIEAQLTPLGLTGVSLGSCATSLALVASGELSGYAEGRVGFWDFAAGVALCESAHVPVSFEADAGSNSSHVAAGPAAIQPDLFEISRSIGDR